MANGVTVTSESVKRCYLPSCTKETEKFLRCARCASALYHDRDCQKAHWQTHKSDCASLKQKRLNILEGKARAVDNAKRDASKEMSELTGHAFDRGRKIGVTQVDRFTMTDFQLNPDDGRKLLDTFKKLDELDDKKSKIEQKLNKLNSQKK